VKTKSQFLVRVDPGVVKKLKLIAIHEETTASALAEEAFQSLIRGRRAARADRDSSNDGDSGA
jgi:hypothetical protein